MRILAFLIAAALTFPLIAGEDLVQAAREQKAKRKSSTSRVITNADVAKNKGKVADSGRGTTPVEPEPAVSEMERHRQTRMEQAAASAQVAAAERIVAAIEQELALIERSYFDESDLDRRDTEIVKRFTEAAERLARARAELESLRNPPSEDAQ